jgi:hypothetical protein
MTCIVCSTAAKANPRTVEYGNACQSCAARILAATGAHLESQDRGFLTSEYRWVLEKFFGADWEAGARLTKEWGAKMNNPRSPT